MGFAAAVREAWCLCGSRFSAPPMLCRRMNPNPLVRGRNTTLGYSLCKLLDGRHFIARGEHSNFFFHHCFHRRTARRCSSAADHRRKAIKPRFQRENRQIHANHTGSLSPAMVACVVVEVFSMRPPWSCIADQVGDQLHRGFGLEARVFFSKPFAPKVCFREVV